jgi:hypothetical protein
MARPSISGRCGHRLVSIDLHVSGRGEMAALVEVLRDHIVEESERFRLVPRRVRGDGTEIGQQHRREMAGANRR